MGEGKGEGKFPTHVYIYQYPKVGGSYGTGIIYHGHTYEPILDTGTTYVGMEVAHLYISIHIHT